MLTLKKKKDLINLSLHSLRFANIIVISLVQPVNTGEGTVGKTLLAERGLYTEERWYWICVAALFGFSLLFNVLFIAALTFLNRK